MSKDFEDLARLYNELAKTEGRPGLRDVAELASVAARISRRNNGPERLQNFPSSEESSAQKQRRLQIAIVHFYAQYYPKSKMPVEMVPVAADLHRAFRDELQNDDLQLEFLKIPTAETLWVQEDPVLAQEKAVIDSRIMAQHNSILNRAERAGLFTVGDVRLAMESSRFARLNQIGPQAMQFLQTAFRKTV